jgi:hypothetical protein
VDDDHLFIAIADVSGKGVPAALYMMQGRLILRNCAMLGLSASQILEKTNQRLCSDNQEDMFITAWVGILEISTGRLTAANAGHEYPAIRRGNNPYELIKTKHSPAVATMEGLRFRQSAFHLDPGDRLFVYTDGVTEATNAQNELFGETRLLKALNRNPDALPHELLPQVKKEIESREIITVYDVKSGKTYKVRQLASGNHCDVEPLTAEDTAIMKEINGGEFTWSPRPVWVTFDGMTIACSIHSMPHDVSTIKDNNFNGHVCMHFLGSKTHNGNAAYTQDHQDAVQAAWKLANK